LIAGFELTIKTMVTDTAIWIGDTSTATSGVRAVAIMMTADCIETQPTSLATAPLRWQYTQSIVLYSVKHLVSIH
jgi:hypothetical protein